MELLIALLLLIVSALLVASLFRFSSKVEYLLCLFLCAWGAVVLSGEIEGLIGQIKPLAGILIELGFVVVAGLLWWRAGKPRLFGPFGQNGWAFWRELPSFKKTPILWIFAIGVGLIYLVGAVVILWVPPNNYDSMTYHLARVGYWLQHQSILPWLSSDYRQITSPMNAELGLLWTIQYWGTDQLAGFVQWLSIPFSFIAIYGIARLLKATKAQSFFAGLVWATFPEIVLQSVTTQNDLVVASLLAAMVYFLIKGLKEKKSKSLCLSGLAMGLAIGTKVTIAFVMPGLVIWLIVLLVLYKKEMFHLLFVWAMSCIVAFALLGSFIYVQNVIVYHSLTPTDDGTNTSSVQITPAYSRMTTLVSNSTLYLFQAIDFSGLPPVIATPLQSFKARVFTYLARRLGIPITTSFYSIQAFASEEISWFGILSVLLLLPMAIYQLIKGIRQKEPYRLGLLLMGIGFLLSVVVLLSWTLYRGRYDVVAATLLAPLLAFYYQSGRKVNVFLWIVMALALVTAGWTTLTNGSHPLIGSNAIWGKDAIQLRALSFPEIDPVIRLVDTQVPAGATLGIKLGGNGWDYVFWGDHFTRKLIQVDPYFSSDGFTTLDGVHFDYLLVGPRQKDFLVAPDGFKLIGQAGNYFLYGPDTSGKVSDVQALLTQAATDPTKLIEVDQTLVGKVGVLETWTGQWPIETNQAQGFYWLGQGSAQGIGFSVWSEETLLAHIILTLTPGPGRTDSTRTLQLIAGKTVVTLTFNQSTQLDIPVTLIKGYSEIGFYITDAPTVAKQPNGDTRPLMALLQKVLIEP